MHFNIQIHIQRVQEPEPLKDSNGYPIKSGGAVAMTERQVTELLKLAVTADTEQEAYAKTYRVLGANQPEPSGE